MSINNFFKTIFSLLIPPFLKGVTGTPVGDFKIPPPEDGVLPLKKGELRPCCIKSPFFKGSGESTSRGIFFDGHHLRSRRSRWCPSVFLLFFSLFSLFFSPLPLFRGGVPGGGVLNPPFLKEVAGNPAGGFNFPPFSLLNPFSSPSPLSRGGIEGGGVLSLLNPFHPLKAEASLITGKTPDSLKKGLVGHWTFDGGDMKNNVADRSGLGNTGYLKGFTSTSSALTRGKIGQGLKFDGVDDRVRTGSEFIGTGADSVTAWVKPLVRDGNNRYIVDNGKFRLYETNSASNIYIFRSTDSGNSASFTAGSVVLNKWVFLAATRDATGVTNIYLNGVLNGAADRVGEAPVNGTTNVIIGNINSGTGNGFNGLIDDVRIYNRALSPSEIKKLYLMGQDKVNAPSSQADRKELMAHWTMDGNDVVTNVKDSSSKGNTGYLRMGTTGVTSTTTAKVMGKRGQALSFDGISDLIRVPHSTSIAVTDRATVGGWVYIDRWKESDILEKGGTGGYVFWNDTATGKIVWGEQSDATHQVASITAGASLVKKWTHIIGTYDGATLKIYLNGALNNSRDVSGISFSNGNALNLGYGGDGYFKGKLDDIRIYNYPMTASEVSALYRGSSVSMNVTSDSISKGLVGHWTFDGPDTSWTSATAGTVTDRSGNGNTGTLTNMNRSTASVIGKIGQGLRFDGVDDEVVLNNYSDFDFSQENAFTIAVWVYPKNTVARRVLFSRGATWSSESGEMYFLGNHSSYGNAWYALISDGTNIVNAQAAQGSLVPNVWQYIILTWNGSILTLYKNAQVIDTGENASFTGLWDNTNPAYRETSIGADAFSERYYWPGKIDDVRIYNRALSPSEIKQLYLMGK